MSAVLNVGWKPSGDEWIRKGDWLNDTHHSVDISPQIKEYNCDITVVKYT